MLAHVGGTLGCIGLALLIVARQRELRLWGLGAWAAGAVCLAAYLAPSGHHVVLAAAGVVGVVLAVAAAAALRRWPWALAFGTLLLVPVRIPVSVGSTEAMLLVPIYLLVAAAAIVLGWELVQGGERARSRELGPIALPLAAFIAWTGISLCWTHDLGKGAVELLFFFLPFGLLAVAMARLPWRPRLLPLLYRQLAAMGVLFALIGIYQYAARDVFWNPKVIVGNAYQPFYRVNSLFWDPSIYGRFLVVATLASLVVAVWGPPGRARLAASAVVVVTWVGLIFSFSQSSFVSLLVAVLVAGVFLFRPQAGVVAGAAALLVVAVLAGASSPARSAASASAVAAASASGSVAAAAAAAGGPGSGAVAPGGPGFGAPALLADATSGRGKLVTEGIRIALDHPIGGVGVGGFIRAYADRVGLKGRNPKSAASHTTVVTVAAEEGVIGLALLGWLGVAALGLPFRRAGRSLEGQAALALGLTLLAISVHSLGYNALFEDPMMWGALGLAALVGCAAGSTRTGGEDGDGDDADPGREEALAA